MLNKKQIIRELIDNSEFDSYMEFLITVKKMFKMPEAALTYIDSKYTLRKEL